MLAQFEELVLAQFQGQDRELVLELVQVQVEELGWEQVPGWEQDRELGWEFGVLGYRG